MGAPGPLLQIIQPAAPRHSPLGSVIHKIKQPPQILPKPPGPAPVHHLNQINFKNAAGAHQNALLFNQMQLQGHPQVPMLVQQQTSTSSASSGVQLILRSPSPAPPKTSQQRLLQSQQQQVMRLITSGSLQLQQIQTSSGPTFIAVPTQPTLHQAHPQPATSPKKAKQTKAKKKREDEQGGRLDLANLMRISGIEEEDVTPTVLVQPPTPSPKPTPPPPSPQPSVQQQAFHIPTSTAVSMASSTAGLPQGIRLALSEDGRSMVVHSPHQSAAPTSVTASVAAAAQAQLNELLAQHGSNILQNSGTTTYINAAGGGGGKQEASLLQSLQVLSWTGSESVVMKSSGAPGGLTLGTPGVVIRRPSQGLVLNDPRYLTSTTSDLSRVQLVANTGTPEQPRYQLVTSAPLNNIVTEQNRQVHIVTNVPQPSQPQHRVIEEQHQTSTTSHHQAAPGQALQQQRLQITSTLLEQQRVEILNEEQKVQLTSLLSTEQQKHITNLLNMGPGGGNTSCEPGKILINSDGTINNSADIDLVNFQNHKNNLLNQNILINNDAQIVNNQSALDILNLNHKNQLLNEAILNNQNSLLANQKMVISSPDLAHARRLDMKANHTPVSSGQIILNNGTLINSSSDLKELLQTQQKLQLNNISIHTSQESGKLENNFVDLTSSGTVRTDDGSNKFMLNNIVNQSLKNTLDQQQMNNIVNNSQQVNNIVNNQKSLEQQLNGQRTQKQERSKKTFNDVYAEHLQAQASGGPFNQSFSIEQPKSNLIYISEAGPQQQHSPQSQLSQQAQNKFLEQQHVNNMVFNSNSTPPHMNLVSSNNSNMNLISNSNLIFTSTQQNTLTNGTLMAAGSPSPVPSPSPTPTPTPMSFIPSKPGPGPAVINDHTNRLQIVMDKPPTPTPGSYIESRTGLSLVQQEQLSPQLLTSKQQLQIVMDSQDNSQIALNDHQNRLQIVMSQPSPDHTSNGSVLAPPPSPQAPPSVSQAPPPRLNGTASSSHVQFVSPRTVIKSHPSPSLLVSSSQAQPQLSPLIPTSQSHPHLTLQPHPQQDVKSPSSSVSSAYSSSTPPVFVNRPNLTVLTQPHPPLTLSSDQAAPGQVPFRSMPQVCDISPTPPSVSSVITPTPTPCNNVRPSLKPSPPQPRPLSSPPPTPTPAPSNYNSFLDSIAQNHPNILINKTPMGGSLAQPVSPAASIIVKKPPVVKKSAVVKPMVMVAPNQEDGGEGAPSHHAPSLDGHPSGVVQRVQTIQLTPQKQQHLKAVQNQITSLSAKDNKTGKDQATLQKLYKEQQSILLSGKIVPTIPGQHAQGLTFVSTPVRLVAPPTITSPPSVPTSQQSKSTSPICVQVGTQTSDDSKSPPPVIITPEPPAPHISSSLSLSKRAALIEQQLSRDILGATRPDTRAPFTSVSDAVKRLVRYHCLDDPVLTERDLAKADEIFEATAQHLLDKKTQMLSKYNYLLIKESMRQVQTSELIMLGRMFVSDESSHLECLRQEARHPAAPPPTPLTSVPSPCIDTPPSTNTSPSPPSSSSLKRDRSPSPSDPAKRRIVIGDDEEINAQVQSAIDSILNLQRSDPITDEAVRSILGTGVTS